MANLIAQGPSKPATTKAKPKAKPATPASLKTNEEDEEGEKAKTKMPEDESSTARDGNIEISMVSSDLKLPEKKARNPNRSSVKKKPENSITFR